jgi:co-chaperonin GroES (HSP10)
VVKSRIPTPTGWRIAILPYRGAEKTKGGIVLSEETQKRTQLATVCGYVLKVGTLAYMDETKFPTGLGARRATG